MLPEKSEALRPIRRDRITDVAYTALRQHILERRFSSGDRIQVHELAEQLGVSRTPVREALNLLAAEGLVDIVPRSGTFVASVSERDVEEVFELRICLEALAAERVARRGISEVEAADLERILQGARAGSSPEERAVSHAEANRAFHLRIVELSGNRKLAQLYPALNAHTMMAFVHNAAPAWSERWELELAEHQRIVDALARGDAAVARQSMEAHLRRGRESLLADMRQGDPDDSGPASDTARARKGRR